jgi:PIN domain nuclease of toxin-antitoxin system
MTPCVVDTHALLRYTGVGSGRLPVRVRRIFEAAEAGRGEIVIPILVAWETALLVEDGAIRLRPSFALWWDTLAQLPGFHIQPLDLEIIKAAYGLTVFPDPSDRLIVATARTLGLPLVSADARIAESGLVEIVW